MDLTANRVSPGALKALSDGDILAIRVPEFLSKGECRRLAFAVTRHEDFVFSGKGFRGVGPGGHQLPMESERYFASAPGIDRLLAAPRTNLEHHIGHLQCPLYGMDKRMRALTARRYDGDFIAPPHQDNDQVAYPWALSQLGISISLVSPERGGEIRVWDLAFGPEKYAKRQLQGRHELDETKIPSCDLEISAGVGELVIINARRIHAINRIHSGERISVSGFLALEGDNTWLWS